MANFQWLTARDSRWGAPLWVRALVVAAALAALGLRFADRDLVPYILDEPRLQEAASADVSAGTWASISPLTGNLGVPYGPGPVWFYAAVHRLAGPRPESSVFAATLFLSLTLLVCTAALSSSLRGGWLLFAALTALLASSPFLFFWSRVAWEVFSGYVALAVALLATDRPFGLGRGALLGALLGLALTSHPMTVPFALAALTVLAWEAVRRRSGGALGACLASLIVVNVPYVLALHRLTARSPASGPGVGSRLLRIPARLGHELLEPARILTTAGVDYFFDSAWPDFRAWLGPASGLLGVGPGLTVLFALLAAGGLLSAARRASPGGRRVAQVGLLAWVGLALLLALLALPSHPHYQLASWWIVPAGIGGLSAALQAVRPRLAGGLLACVLAVALAQAAFNREWMGWVRERGGTAGIHYSVPMAAQRVVLQTACGAERPQVALANQTYVFPASLLSLAHTEPACLGKRIAVCPGPCPPLDTGWREVSMRYAAYPGGRLALLVRQ